MTIADINVIVIYSFQRNIAAGDLDVFAFASPSSAADCRSRAVSAAGLCIYSAALNGNVPTVTSTAAANTSCFAAGYRRYITITNRNILTRCELTSANACTQDTALGGDGAAFDHNIAAAFLGTTANACTPVTAVSLQLTGAADGQGPVVVGLFHTGVVPAALQGIRAADDQLHITADRDCRTGSIDIDIMQRHFCCRGAAFDGQGVGRLVVVCGNDQIRYLPFDVLLFGILLAVLNGNDNAAVAEIHRCDRLRDIILHIQHAHRAFGSGAQLHQRIGALSQRRSGKGEHHASGQRRRYCTPDKFALFHGITSFFPLAFLRGGVYITVS